MVNDKERSKVTFQKSYQVLFDIKQFERDHIYGKIFYDSKTKEIIKKRYLGERILVQGVIHQEHDRLKEAIKSYERAIRLVPDLIEAYLRLGKICRITYSCIIVFLFISSSALAASYYLDATNGNDRHDGLSPERAWKTIRKINRETFNPGDEIKFKRGQVFNDFFLIVPSSGKKGNPITFKDYGNTHHPLPILTYSGNSTIWMIDKVFVSFNNLELLGGKKVIEIKQSAKGETHHLVFKDCVIRNSRIGIWVDTATGGLVEGCKIYNCDIGFSCNDPGFTVRDCKIHDNNYGIKLGIHHTVIERNEIYHNIVGIRYNPGGSYDEVIFRYNLIRNNKSHGFETWFGSGNVGEIYYNIFSNNGGDGLLLKGKVTANLYNNLIYSNGLNGIHLDKERGYVPYNITLKNNIIMNNRGFEIKVAKSTSGFTSDYNCIYHSAGGSFIHWLGMDYNWKDWKSHSSQDAHSINQAPLFIDETKNNFRLTSGSPCINTGFNVGLTGVDYYGNPIPSGNFDMGVHEVKVEK